MSELVADPDNFVANAEASFQAWMKRKETNARAREQWLRNLPKRKRGILGRLDPFTMRELLQVINHTDCSYINDLCEGFPMCGAISTGGLGIDIDGGVRCHGKPGLGGPQPLTELRDSCRQINSETLLRAQSRVPKTKDDWELSARMWEQIQVDISAGRAGPPVNVSELDLDSVLLVDSFGIWECHGEKGEWKVRTIRDFHANFVNDYAWLPQRMKYVNYDNLQSALSATRRRLVNAKQYSTPISIGKADFKSAFKTLPPKDDQTWMCWSLVFDPDACCLKAVPMWSHVFGNIGSVAAWYRTVKAIQAILHGIFRLPISFYVDDGFWVATEYRTVSGMTMTEWIGDLFSRVATNLLGWDLDPNKAAAGCRTVVLGLQITVRTECTWWRLAPAKRFIWIQDL